MGKAEDDVELDVAVLNIWEQMRFNCERCREISFESAMGNIALDADVYPSRWLPKLRAEARKAHAHYAGGVDKVS